MIFKREKEVQGGERIGEREEKERILPLMPCLTSRIQLSMIENKTKRTEFQVKEITRITAKKVLHEAALISKYGLF